MKLVVVSGALANKPFNGGNAWSRLSWISVGMSMADLTAQARDASCLFNISGHLKQRELKSCFDCKVYYDDDPGFTQRVEPPFEIALQIHPADSKDLEALKTHGWQIVDPKQVADSPDAFRKYVRNSSAEFSVAQGIYVDTNSGWFSDRTVRYLASGKPALVQETGFSRHIPVGKGLLSFRTMDEAVEGARCIVRDYEHHCLVARRVAEEYFDSDKVIGQMLAEIGLAFQPASE